MMRLRSLRHHSTLAIVVALAWLPHAFVRCTESPATHNGCVMKPATDHSGDGHHADHPEALAQHADHHGEHHGEQGQPEGPQSTCCEITGKCNILVTSDTLPVPILAALPLHFTAPLVEVPQWSVIPVLPNGGHDPPAYLRNAILLI